MSTVFFSSHNESCYKTEKWRHIFSQWYTSPNGFTIKEETNLPIDITKYINKDIWTTRVLNVHFVLREQFMMYMKALVFSSGKYEKDNLKIAENILKETSPLEIKKLGRLVADYKESIWSACRYEIVVVGNYLDFTQNPNMLKILCDTGKRELVEASAKDTLWAIGIGISAAPTSDKSKWGKNLLGKAIMEARDIILQ